jgi:hypothetical protein
MARVCQTQLVTANAHFRGLPGVIIPRDDVTVWDRIERATVADAKKPWIGKSSPANPRRGLMMGHHRFRATGIATRVSQQLRQVTRSGSWSTTS